MTCRSTRVLTLLLVCVLTACAPELGDTSILITVDSDLTVPDEIDRVTLEIPGLAAGMDDPAADLREKDLPRSIALRYTGGAYGPLRIVVSAYHGDTQVAQKTVETSFLPGIQSSLAVNLARGCANVFCSEGLSCTAGACVPVSEILPSPGGEDAGAGAGSDASRPSLNDAGVANLDAATVGPQDSGVRLDAGPKLDAGTKLDASSGADAGPANDGSVASDARAVTDTGALGDTGPRSDTGVPPVSAGATPVCTISKPAANDTVLTGVTFALQGACLDAESGVLSAPLWASSVDGALAMGASTSGTLRTVGAHNIMLCAPDPRDARVVGCATVRVNATVQPTARILSLRQGARDTEPFAAGTALTIQGTATGTGATMTWRDSLQGALGTGSTVMLSSPVAGRHVITLDVTDQYGLTASATRTFWVMPTLPGH